MLSASYVAVLLGAPIGQWLRAATLPLLFMSNAFVPLKAMPGWMEVTARLNPLTYAISSMRTLVLDGWDASLASQFGVLAIVASCFLAIGTIEFRRLTGERVR